MKKWNEKQIHNVSFKLMETRKRPYVTEYDVKVQNGKDRGIADLNIFGPKSKQICTVVVNKSKKYELKYAEILAALRKNKEKTIW